VQKENYNSTLNLPNTKFPMRANLPEKEKDILNHWEKENAYEKLKEKKKSLPSYTLHDGPPYANGAIHMGHALNKVLKDFVVRYKNMSGFRALLVPGWDTHGLPTELKAMKKVKSSNVSTLEIRKICKEFVEKYIEEQKEDFKRLGVLADFENPYITLNKDYEAAQLEVFAKMVKKGCIYRGLKPVYWCSSCRTALAEAEIEYQKDECKSIYVKFKVKENNGIFKDLGIDENKINFLIWTTTTWTLPANIAICLNKDFIYSLLECEGEYYIIAKDLVKAVLKGAGKENYKMIKNFKGEELQYIKTEHPFLDKTSLVILGDHVTLESGTGCVHTAPGHGLEDFAVCQNYEELLGDIPLAVDHKGKMTEICGDFSGLTIEEANEKIYENLKRSGRLFATKVYDHSYPHCWRCKKPVIFRATKQWFCSIDSFKKDAVEESQKVMWVPSWGKERIKSMITERKDWCISRQRKWGVPIPAFYCKDCGNPLLDEKVILHVADLFRESGSDIWYEEDEKDLLPEGTSCKKCGGKEFNRETDILDVWFDSGVSHTAVCKAREDLNFPADLYLEGADQYRGWFQSSLLTSVAANGVAPYKTVVTHGWVVDGEGRKQSKSLGNGISPQDIIKTYGADVLRLWVAASDYHADVKISDNILKQIAESYRKIRNTARYILGNLFDFDPKKDIVDLEKLQPLDRWILYKLNFVIEESANGYETFEFSKVYRNVYNFCVVELSNYYLDVIKDRLYVRAKNSPERRSAQTAVYVILDALVRIISPILPFTSHEIWQYVAHTEEDDSENILFNFMPKKLNFNIDSNFVNLWTKIDNLREEVVKKLELFRGEKVIGSSLEASVDLNFYKKENYDLLKPLEKILEEVFIVSKVNLALKEQNSLRDENSFEIVVRKAAGEKCPRCWCFSEHISKKDEKFVCKKCEEVLKNF